MLAVANEAKGTALERLMRLIEGRFVEQDTKWVVEIMTEHW